MIPITRISLGSAIERLMQANDMEIAKPIEEAFNKLLGARPSVDVEANDLARTLANIVVTYLSDKRERRQAARAWELHVFTYIVGTASVLLVLMCFLPLNFSMEHEVLTAFRLVMIIESTIVSLAVGLYIRQLKKDNFFSHWPVYCVWVGVFVIGIISIVLMNYWEDTLVILGLFTAHILVILEVIFDVASYHSPERTRKTNLYPVQCVHSFLKALGVTSKNETLDNNPLLLQDEMREDELANTLRGLISDQ